MATRKVMYKNLVKYINDAPDGKHHVARLISRVFYYSQDGPNDLKDFYETKFKESSKKLKDIMNGVVQAPEKQFTPKPLPIIDPSSLKEVDKYLDEINKPPPREKEEVYTF